ncbi:hypothetical protein AB0E85_39980, partial [Streptomyces sp. NPDC029044]
MLLGKDLLELGTDAVNGDGKAREGHLVGTLASLGTETACMFAAGLAGAATAGVGGAIVAGGLLHGPFEAAPLTAEADAACTHPRHERGRPRGRADKPFLITVQPSVVDPTRAPAGKHVFWAYGHV